jgi:conjugative relaxase-like TrwC/TraI family protein
MSAASIGSGKAAGYARYLEGKTLAPQRGDYYLRPDGSVTEAPGRWLPDAETLAGLGVSGAGPLEGPAFLSVMEGRHPHTGRWLRRAGADGTRGGGIDVTFSAPKSVSIVWALSDSWQREQLEAAHERAVQRAVEYMRENVGMVRRRYGTGVVEEPARDLVAAGFLHTTARGADGAAAPDPQLHTHVVLVGAVREDGRYVAVASRPVFRAAREVGAFYRSALAEELRAQGYPIQQGTGRDGKYFEIARVPEALRDAFSSRSREVAAAAERFRAAHGRAPERGELRELALENRRAKQLATRGDLQRAWARTATEHAFGPDQAVELIGARDPRSAERSIRDQVEAKLTEREAVFDAGRLRAVALEQSAGELAPEQALQVAREMLGERRVLTLEGGRMTTLAVRAQEQEIERQASTMAQPAGRDVGEMAREVAQEQVAARVGFPLSGEQRTALRALTGPERLAVLVGPAGTGKGVVIDAAARAEQQVGREVLGVAVAGATAERLGRDSPAIAGKTLTIDALVARSERGSLQLTSDTTVVLDEAGMVDHQRMDALTGTVERAGAKLIAVGDGRQLPSIGPGGMFDRIALHAPTAELADVHRTLDPGERKAWAALRAGEPERAMAHYRAQGRLHFADTRDQAGERAVQTWARLLDHHDPRQVALIADASNVEIDRLNARAQHLRAERGELGPEAIPFPGRHHGLREGDLITFTATHRPRDGPRVENGTRGEVTHIDAGLGSGLVRLDGSEREIRLDADALAEVRLAYAQHVYRQQGATVERAIIITGGWPTTRETAYVQASRARNGSDWYLAREELGLEGQDEQRVERLAQKMRDSRLHAPSLSHREIEEIDWQPSRERPRQLGRGRTLSHLVRRLAASRDVGPDRGR